MRKPSNYYRFIIILLFLIIILVITIFIQFIDENNKVGYFATELKNNDLLFQNLVTEKSYIEYLLNKNSINNCNEIEKSFSFSIKKQYDLTNKLSSYLENSDFSWNEYSYLRGRLLNYQISYWLLANKIKKTCNSKFIPILYFFSNEKTCKNCKDQAVILNHLRKISGNYLMICSLDATFDGSIYLLKKRYNITNDKVSVVIGEDNVYNYLNLNNAKKEICNYDNKVNFC